MGKNVPLSEVERAQIVALHKEDHSERLISQKMKKSKTAVHNAMAKFRNTGTYTTAKKSGRPRKTTPRDDHAIRRIAVRSPFNRRDGVVVRASASQSVDLGFIPLVESYQKTLKNGIHSFPAWRSAFRGGCGEQAGKFACCVLGQGT